MSSTFTGPLRIFKRNNPTNNGVIAPDNTGAAQVSQIQYFNNITGTVASTTAVTVYNVGSTTASNCVVPAGSIIDNITLYEYTAPSALTNGVITAYINVTNPTTGAVTTTAIGTITPTTTGGQIQIAFTNTAAVAALLNNVGTLDASITYAFASGATITGNLAGSLKVDYVARNVDGSLTPYGAGLTNQ